MDALVIEPLIGYDAREWCFNTGEMWPEDRRQRYLLQYEVGKPLSVDTIVWPSIFDTGQGSGAYAEERVKAGFVETIAQTWVGPNNGLCESLADLLKARSAISSGRCGASQIVAITLMPEPGSANAEPPYVIGNFVPDNRWELLGYDVADSSQISGLLDCAFSPREAADLAPRWGISLNRYHLFSDPRQADLFRSVADKRVPDHSPFHVCGVWLLNATS